MDYSQKNSVFQPGLTARGPVYNATPPGFGALPALSSPIKYGLIAALLYLGYAKKIPFGLPGGAAAAFAVYQFFPDAAAAAAAGAPSAADIAASTAGAGNIDVGTIDPGTVPSISLPSLSGLGHARQDSTSGTPLIPGLG